MKTFIILIMSSLMFISCDKGAKSPEGLIKMYINDLSSTSIQKDYFKEYATGQLLENIESLSDDDFKNYLSVRNKVKRPKIEISNKNCMSDKCTLTYIIKYNLIEKATAEEKERTYRSEVKKIATLIKEGEVWKISDVSNVKTFIEAKQPLEVLQD